MSDRPVTSRLAQKEQKKLLRQTLLMIITAMALILGFVFVILPGIIRLAAGTINADPVAKTTDNIPPQIPTLAAPVSATYSATINLAGYGEAGSEIIFVVNGNETGQKIAGSEGTFDFELSLTEGENLVTVFSRDAAKNESAPSKKYLITLDTKAPAITDLEPASGARVTLRKNQITTIKGKTEPRAKVFLNERLTLANAEGVFSSSYSLVEGDNKIKIRAIDPAGNSSETELVINFAY